MELRILILKEDNVYVAQCLEYDLATHAEDLYDLNYAIQRMFVAHIISCQDSKIEPFDLPTAPDTYSDTYYSNVSYVIELENLLNKDWPQFIKDYSLTWKTRIA